MNAPQGREQCEEQPARAVAAFKLQGCGILRHVPFFNFAGQNFMDRLADTSVVQLHMPGAQVFSPAKHHRMLGMV